ncbi:MAG TPA: hypothetical protein VM100_12830, partial [Longimicrobiales bacterium]|nr:hypothetical protein [Longimicrobiales bacterium]
MKKIGKTLGMVAAMFAGSLGCDPSSTELANEQATLTITPVAAQVEIGDEVSLTSRVQVNGNTVDRDRTWEATNPSVAELVWSSKGPENGSSRVFGKALGSAVVTVKYKDQSASATVTVVPAKPWTVEISPRDLALEIGSQTQLVDFVRNSSGATKLSV